MSLTDPYHVLAAARLIIYEKAPYFKAGILNLVPRARPGLGTFATTKHWIMLWDPAKAVEWGPEKTAAVMVHELWHCIRDHHARFEGPSVEKTIANCAMDLSINPGVKQMGFTLPDTVVMPDQFKLPDNLTAEQYYEKLMKMDIEYVYHLEDGSPCDAQGNPTEGQGNQDGKKGDAHGKKFKVERCGSCAGNPVHNEPGAEDEEGRSENEGRRTKIIIAQAIKDASNQRGNMPGDLSRWAEMTLKPPKVRWEEKLQRACRAAVAYRPGSGFSTYSKVSRRQAGLGFGLGRPVIPSVRGTTPRVTFLIDTSGSMGQNQLEEIMGEAQGIFKVCNAEVDVIVCDAQVHGFKRVKSVREACKMLHGGGGSSFLPAFDEIEKRKPKNDIIIAATDGMIEVPPHEPAGSKVIWLLVGPYKQKPCNWGTFIEIDEKERSF